MKNKLRKIRNNILVGGSIVLASLIPRNVKGQNPAGLPSVINPFISPDTTEAAKIYNTNNDLSLEAIAAKNTLVDNRIKASRVHTIPPNDNPLWNCNQWSQQQVINAYNFGDNVYDLQWNKLLYNGYKGFVLQQLYANGGTLADEGIDGLPMFAVSMTDSITLPSGHAMNLVFTGNNVLKQSDRNNIEPRDGVTQVQPGQINIPLNCKHFIIGYPYIFKNSDHDKNFTSFRILEFQIVNGVMSLTYNINDDPNFNKSIHLITERENDPPVLNVMSATNPDSLRVKASDANLDKILYSVDGGAKKPLTSGTGILMGLTPGTHNIKVTASDYFRLVTDTTFQRTITEPEPTSEKTMVGPNPVENNLHIKYKSNLSNNAYMTLTTLDGKPILRKKINSTTEETLDMTRDKPGIYILQVIDGKNKETYKIIR
jgi:hypothetical protein